MALGTSNINISLVRSTIGESSYVLSTLCKSSKVNKWSAWKPTRSNISTLTLAEIKAKHCSLQEVVLTDTPQEWAYLKPTGGSSSPYRLGDFREYNHSATRPTGVVSNSSVTLKEKHKSLITKPADYLAFLNDTQGYNWKMKNAGVVNDANTNVYETTLSFIKCRMQYQDSSNYMYINCDYTTFGNALPLNWLADGSQGWRLGAKIQYSSYVWYICGMCPIGEGVLPQDYLPCFLTNMEAVNILQTSSRKEVLVTPCLMRNVSITPGSVANQPKISVDTSKDVFSMPDGTGATSAYVLGGNLGNEYEVTITVYWTKTTTSATITKITGVQSKITAVGNIESSWSCTPVTINGNLLNGDGAMTISGSSTKEWENFQGSNNVIPLYSGGYGSIYIQFGDYTISENIQPSSATSGYKSITFKYQKVLSV